LASSAKPGAPGPRIIAGAFRGRRLAVPEGLETRPTSARARQAAFDILLHAAWAGADWLRETRVLDVFAGSGAFGLEALSRGAAGATFIEQAPAALACLRANIASCRVEARVVAADALASGPGAPHGLVCLDPPYGQALVPRAVARLAAQGWVAPGAVGMAELGPGDDFAPGEILGERTHGKARLLFWRF
jgi:16S rRNA (guanine966-N2)-methyltransferase